MIVQSVLIPRDRYSLSEAKRWIKNHNFTMRYKGKAVDITENYYRFRQHKPVKDSKYRVVRLNNDILIILMG